MFFTLEALNAKHGDALILHYGPNSSPHFVVIDGGPSEVYEKALKPRLDQIAAKKHPGQALPVQILMVSHIDLDHITGVIQLTQELVDLREDGKPEPYEVMTLWHNSFDDILDNDEVTATAGLAASIQPAMSGGAFPAGLAMSKYAAMVAGSVPMGRKLRQNAETLSLSVNAGFKKLVRLLKTGAKTIPVEGGLNLTVIAPMEQQLLALQEEWNEGLKKLKEKGALPSDLMAFAAAFTDKSASNLSSIVVLAEAGGKTMLLTGDARGDFIVEGLKAAGLMKNNKAHVDVLKLPHHGSDRNVTTEFFQQVTADHYVVSADGRDGNPDIPTLQMLSNARGKEKFTLYLTNRNGKEGLEKKLTDFFASEKKKKKKYQVVSRAAKDLSVKVELADPLDY